MTEENDLINEREDMLRQFICFQCGKANATLAFKADGKEWYIHEICIPPNYMADMILEDLMKGDANKG